MDLNALNQAVLRLIENGTKIISFLKDFTVGSAGDVSITYINADGSESVRTFPNIAKMVESYNIKSVSGTIVEQDGTMLLDRIYSETKTVTCVADTPLEIFNLNSMGSRGFKSVVLEVSWSNAKNSDDSYRIWSGGLSTVLRNFGGRVHNGSPIIDLDMKGIVHLSEIQLPTFKIYSNENDGSYGDPCVYLTCVEDLTFNDLKISIRGVM